MQRAKESMDSSTIGMSKRRLMEIQALENRSFSGISVKNSLSSVYMETTVEAGSISLVSLRSTLNARQK